MSGRLEEMPGEEGYPAYLASRLAEFYERAGIVNCLGSGGRLGAISAIGAVSPPGGDTSEPVSQATLRIVKVFWSLSSSLAYARHFPAIDWLKSYSLYEDDLRDSFDNNHSTWSNQVIETKQILQEEAELDEIVRLVGIDSLDFKDRLTLECARSIREDFLHQNAFHEIDTYTSLGKQYYMLKVILDWYHKAQDALKENASFSEMTTLPVLEKIGRFKYVKEEDVQKTHEEIQKDLNNEFNKLTKGGDF